jgi:cell division protein FtsW
LHIGANVALIPINGNTLPFLSYGGSSTIINLAAMGILLNISKGGNEIKENITEQKFSAKLHRLRKRG